MTSELKELVRRCLSGEQAAMVELVQRYQGPVFGICYRMLGQRQDAEDAAQETFVRVLKNLQRWDAERDFEPWLLAIAGNRCRTALASRRRRPMHRSLEIPLDDPQARADSGDLLAEEVARGLQRIRPEYREAFLLFHEHELSYEAIAHVMHRPLGTIKTWIHRARLELIRDLQSRQVIEETRHALH
jgi:RNA polymerase sigma-70 factor (ECF subfamily)